MRERFYWVEFLQEVSLWERVSEQNAKRRAFIIRWGDTAWRAFRQEWARENLPGPALIGEFSDLETAKAMCVAEVRF